MNFFKRMILSPKNEGSVSSMRAMDNKKFLDYEGLSYFTGKAAYKAGNNIEITSNRTINVSTTDEAKQGDSRPITSSGCYTILGNIETLLKEI